MNGRTRSRIGAALLAALVVAATLLPVQAATAATATIDRLSGADRYQTSAAISSQTYSPGIAVAYIAGGAAFPDALAGAPAAGMQGAPILLTHVNGVPWPTALELQRLQPGRIVILGGDGVVPEAVKTELAQYTTGEVTRLSGVDRYETAAAIAGIVTTTGGVVYLANGEAFPDSLAGATVAARDGAPLLLTAPEYLPPATAGALARLRPSRIVVLGGPSAVSGAVADQAAAVSGASVERRAGSDRYTTSVAVSGAAFPTGAPTVFLASGADFPDALSAAAAARGAPLLLTNSHGLPASVAREIIRLAPTRVVMLGGESAVSATVRDQLGIVGTTLPAATGGRLTQGSEIRAGECLASADASHRLCVDAGGSVVLRRGDTALWSSGSADFAPRALRIRSDGNLVLYSVDGRQLWDASTADTGATELVMQNDGDAMLRTSSGAIRWSTMTSASAPQWRLPYATGQRWAAGGPHTNSGGVGARGSLDFGPTSGGDRRVLAIADGTVYRVQCGTGSYLGINHANGWQSTYYHLVNYQDQLVGQYVPAGTYLGDVGRTVPCGGGATFDHVHLTIRRGGEPVSVEGMRFGGYTVRSTGRDYWGIWTDAAGNRVLTSSGGAYCCLAAQ